MSTYDRKPGRDGAGPSKGRGEGIDSLPPKIREAGLRLYGRHRLERELTARGAYIVEKRIKHQLTLQAESHTAGGEDGLLAPQWAKEDAPTSDGIMTPEFATNDSHAAPAVVPHDAHAHDGSAHAHS